MRYFTPKYMAGTISCGARLEKITKNTISSASALTKTGK